MANTRQKVGRIGLNDRGPYDPLAAYTRLDMVSHGGSSWSARRDVTGVEPTEGLDWLLLAKRGEPGEPGAPGDPGEQGPPGEYKIIGDAYATVEALEAGVPNPEMGELRNVGAAPPYNVYRWTGTKWEPQGKVQGVDGRSAYQIAVAAGFVGTEDEWIASLQGTDGDDGRSAYQIAVDAGFVGTEAQWLASLQGKDGLTTSVNSREQVDGKIELTAYDIPTSDMVVTVETVAQQDVTEGGPSPESPAPIAGHASVEVVHTGADGTPIGTIALTPAEPLYGLEGAKDSISSAGQVMRRSGVLVLDGTEAWTLASIPQPADTDLFIASLATATMMLRPTGLCTHFAWQQLVGSTTRNECMGGHSAAAALRLCMKKSRIDSWSDDWSSAEKATAIRAFLAAQHAAGTPVTVVYELAAPATETIPPVPLTAQSADDAVTSPQGDTIITRPTSVQSSLAGLAAKSRTFEATLDKDDWVDNAQAIMVSGFTGAANGAVGYPTGMDAVTKLAAAAAMLRVVSLGAGTVIIACATIPTVDIPIEIMEVF